MTDLLAIAVAIGVTFALIVAYWLVLAAVLVGPDGLVKELRRYMPGDGR